MHTNKIYFAILIFVIGAIALSIVIISSILFFRFSHIAMDEIITTNKLSNQYVDKHVVNMFNNALHISNKIYNDYAVLNLTDNKEPDIYELNKAFIELKNYRLTNDTIHSIYIYNAYTDTLYVEAATTNIRSILSAFLSSSQSFPDHYARDLITDYKNQKPFTPIPRKIKEGDSDENDCYTILMYDIYSKASKNNLVMVNFSYDAIFNTDIDVQGKDVFGDVFAVNQQGILISKSKKYSMLDNLSKLSFVRDILESQALSGYFENKTASDNDLIIYNKNNPYGWAFVSVIPWASLSQKINQIKLITVLSDLIIFVLLIIIAYLISRKIYNPIYKIITELKNDKSNLRSNKMVMRQIFLKDVILGQAMNTEEYLTSNYKKFEIGLEYNSRICLILLHIDKYELLYSEINIREQDSIKYAIVNVAKEIFLPKFKAEGTEMENDLLAVVVGFPYSYTGDIQKEMEYYIKEIQQNIKAIFDITLSAAVSSAKPSIRDISSLYKEASKALQHKFFMGYGCIIYSPSIIEKSITDYRYPVKHEKRLINCLDSFDSEHAKEEYNQIVEEAKLYPVSCVEMVLSQLVFAINNFIKIKKIDYLLQLPVKIETLSLINDFFYHEFENLCDLLTKEKNEKYIDVVTHIDHIINSEYMNPGLSIDYIAEKIGLSVSHICRLYKQITCNTILDKIFNVRIGKSKELLLKTKMPVCEVSTMAGFSSASYFNKAFKKATGMTPNRYRQLQISPAFGEESYSMEK